MKHLIGYLSIVCLSVGALSSLPEKSSAQAINISLQVFYDQLSPYGHWIQHDRHGYVWIPAVDISFSPYATQGHWRLTNNGWIWISDYSWGWAPFHYGRWDFDTRYGWLWVPDIYWGPGWVNWRSSNGYFGWSPMEPSRNYGQRDYNRHNDRFIFVNRKDFDRPDINNYYIDKSKNVTIINNTIEINNTHIDNSTRVSYNGGPRKEDVQKSTGKSIKEATVQEVDKPGQRENGDKVELYKPRVNSTSVKGRKPAPQKIDKSDDLKKEWEQKNGNSGKKVKPAPKNPAKG